MLKRRTKTYSTFPKWNKTWGRSKNVKIIEEETIFGVWYRFNRGESLEDMAAEFEVSVQYLKHLMCQYAKEHSQGLTGDFNLDDTDFIDRYGFIVVLNHALNKCCDAHNYCANCKRLKECQDAWEVLSAWAAIKRPSFNNPYILKLRTILKEMNIYAEAR